MKKFLIVFIAFLSFFNSFSQIQPVKWSIETEKISETEFNLIYKASIDQSWHLYSQELPEGGAIPTEFIYDSIQSTQKFKLIGKAVESESITKFDKVFEMDLTFFDNEASFTQKIELIDPDLKFIESEISFQACDDELCIFDSEIVTFNLTDSASSSGITNGSLSIDEKSKELAEKLNINVKGWDKYEVEEVKEKSNFSIFILGFLGGLIALLTPCVFPMIPLTVSFFTKSANNSKKGMRDSILYGFFIFLIYVILSLPFHLLDTLDPEILNNISTNVVLNIIFFAIFIAFAISFFGYFELTLPQSWSNALDNKANKIGGWIGVFFMALTLAIVSFSCTGPILGTLLGSSLSTDAGATQLTMGMSGFGLSLALPFTLFAMFPKWLNSLPKSGGWLNTVKVVLGFVELALALKFLSNADLVEHWGLLKREVFIGLWILIGLGLFLYLIGKIKFPHDGPLKRINFSRGAFAFLVLAFVIYLVPGLQKNPIWNLNALSGFPPPTPYSIYERDSECPLGLNCYKDFDEGVAAAEEQGKPIMLDFTGWACVNCRKMEEQVWSKDKVYSILENDYIIISLYVDDRRDLPKEEQFKYLKTNGSIKNIRSIGDKWATFQTINFQNNSQPYYVLLNH
ncbi:MAG: thioredoxin family protein, partial [Bacteroidia bacterium]|nr:thioredoxin family protein [Bacteroidia bacterium]